MPLLTITTNQSVEDPTSLCQTMSQAVASMLGKPESYVMVVLHPDRLMSFAGSLEPAAMLELKSLGLPEARTPEFSGSLCSLISEHINVPANRIYIEFSSPERHMWGWDNRTFG